MGLSSNQARFLSLTARQIDLEQRTQQICQRRLRLASELERVAQEYNNSISNRKLFNNNINPYDASQKQALSFENLKAANMYVYDAENNVMYGKSGSANTIYSENVTEVTTAQEFINALQNTTANSTIVVKNDLDLTSAGFSTVNNFNGKLYAEGFSITTDKALFNTVSNGAYVYDLKVQAAAGTTLSDNGSGLIANTNNGTIDNVMVSGDINALNNNIAAVAGINNGTISNATSTANITNSTSSANTGGIAGTNNGQINTALSTGTIIGGDNTAGITGENNGSIEKATSLSTINGTTYSGAIAGTSNALATITSVLGGGVVNASTQYSGGIVGFNDSNASITDSYSIADVNGTTSGSLVGINYGNIDATNYYTSVQSGVSGAIGTGTAVNAVKVADVTEIPAANLSSNWDKTSTIPTIDGIPLNVSITSDTSSTKLSSVSQINSTNYTALTSSAGLSGAELTTYNNLATVVGNTGLGSNDLEIVKYKTAIDSNSDGIFEEKDIISVAVKSANGLKALETTGFNSTDATARTAALGGNYLLTEDIDMAAGTTPGSVNWVTGGSNGAGGAYAFTGVFDGNNHSIQNIIMNETFNSTGAQSAGFIGNNYGTIKNLTLTNMKMNVLNNVTSNNNSYVGAVAGVNANTIQNCHVENLNMVATGYSIRSIGGLTGVNADWGSIGNIDKSSVTGSITVDNIRDGVGGLVGWNKVTNAVITNSYTNVTVTSSTNGEHISKFIGNGEATVTNCYALGTVINGSPDNNDQNQDERLLCNNGGIFQNSFVKDGSSYYIYDNGTSSEFSNAVATTDVNAVKTAIQNNVNVEGQNIPTWIFPGDAGYTDPGDGSPILNIAGMNIVTVYAQKIDTVQPQNTDLMETATTVKNIDTDIETGLRTGKYVIAKDADNMTQTPFNFDGTNYELIDWRTIPSISDELFAADDTDAENKYDTTIANINSQDKKLQLEQSSVEVEYKAISSEKEAVKKILENNATNSFKYFG